jgi:hypothetical protein
MDNGCNLIHSFQHTEREDGNYNGLTKREYFAGLAMQGLLSNPAQIDTTNFEWVAQHALGYADALLKELEKPTNNG